MDKCRIAGKGQENLDKLPIPGDIKSGPLTGQEAM
jgi:hypothetical protein